jgi:hypothetical protein
MANRYSPVFTIDITTAVSAGQIATVSDLNQAFELIGVQVVGSAGAKVTVKNSGATAGIGYVQDNLNGAYGYTITNANSSFASTAVITCEVATNAVTRITLLCRAIDAVARQITVTVA